MLIPLAFSSRESLSLLTGSSLGRGLGIGLLDTGAFVASALGFATGQVAIVSVLASLYSAVAVVLTAIFLRERLHVIQWLGMSMLLAGGTDACVEDMLHPTHWNKPTRFYVSSREKKRWHPSLLEHKELLF